MTRDLNDDPEFRRWAKRVKAELVPMIESSEMTVSLCPVSEKIDVKFSVELGVSIMLDKPIIAVVPAGMPVPERLVRVADEIIEWHDDPKVLSPRITEAVERVGRRNKRR